MNPNELTKEQQDAYSLMLEHLSRWASAYVCSENYLIEDPDIEEASRVLGLTDPTDFAKDVKFWVSVQKDGQITPPLSFA